MANHQFKQNKADEYYTKDYAVIPILEYIKKNDVVWCPFDSIDSNFVKIIKKTNKVISSHIDDGKDFFDYEPLENYNIIISNPPYSLREPILDRLFKLGKPFAMLINEAGLFDSKKRFSLLSENNFEMMIFDRRIDYIKEGITLKGVPFKSIYLCSELLPSKFIFKHICAEPRVTRVQAKKEEKECDDLKMVSPH